MKIAWVFVLLIGCAEPEDMRSMASSNQATFEDKVAEAGDAGANNPNENAEDEPSEQDNSVLLISYDEIVAPLVADACVNCHSANGSQPGLPLDTAANLEAAIDISIMRVKDDANPMPPMSEAPLRADIAKILQDWKDQGFPKSAQ